MSGQATVVALRLAELVSFLARRVWGAVLDAQTKSG
jgi:hypothetical protein